MKSYVLSFLLLPFQLAVLCYYIVVLSVRLHVLILFSLLRCSLSCCSVFWASFFLLLLGVFVAGCKGSIVIGHRIVFFIERAFESVDRSIFHVLDCCFSLNFLGQGILTENGIFLSSEYLALARKNCLNYQ